jgi:mono/diheme cytochrome c family protein
MAGILTMGFLAGDAKASAGANLYRAKCQACHGVAGKGNPALKKVYGPNIDLTGEATALRTDDELRKSIRNGAVKGKMPAFKNHLTDLQIDELIRHLRSLGTPPPNVDLNDQ